MTLRAVLFTREEPFFIPEYISPLLASPHAKIVAVYIDERASPHLSAMEILSLCSPAGLFRLFLLSALSKIPRGLRIASFPGERRVASIMRDRGIPVYALRDVKSDFIRDSLRRLSPDIIISIANSRILTNDILGIARVVALNSHSSLLPRYKGILTGFWHLLNGESEGGVTIHRMDERTDSGDIFGQRAFAIGPNETIFTYYRKAAAVGGSLWAEVAAALDSGRAEARPNVSGGPVYGKPSREERRRFRQRRLSFV